MRTSRRGGTRAGALAILLALGGAAAPSIAAGSWQRVGNMTESRNYPTATLLADGTVLVAGGHDDHTRRSTERFDPKTNTFTPSAPMQAARMRHAAVRLQDGRVLVLGGIEATGNDIPARMLASAEVYDPATGTFSPVGDMTAPRELPTATLLPDGRVLVVGGFDWSTGKMLATAELFDPTSGKFQATGSLTVPRRFHHAVALPDGRVAILGGFPVGGQVPRGVEIYDPASGAFTPRGELVGERWASSATLLPGGKILLAGGLYLQGPRGDQSTRNTLEIYDPATGQSVVTDRMSAPRWSHTAVALADGRVLLAGGGRDPTSASLLLFTQLVDPTTGRASLGEPMNEGRLNAVGVLLPDGRALVLGGYAFARRGALASAEVYVP